MQAQAYQLGQAGVGAYEPYITGAGAAGMAPGAAPMGAAAATTLGGVPSYLTQAGAYSGPTGYQDFMSPYQQDVIDTTMADFDAQSAKGLAGIGQKAALSGQFLGGGREGVQRAEYQALSDRNRASMLAQLRQQGFGQAQAGAGQAFQQQMGLGQAQQGLAQATNGHRIVSSRTRRSSTRITITRHFATGSIGRDPTSARTSTTRCNTRS